MYFDLNVPVVAHQGHGTALQSKKNKGKQPQATSTVVFTPAQVTAIEARIDLLVHCQSFVAFFPLLFDISKRSRIHRHRPQPNHREENRPEDACQHLELAPAPAEE